MSKESKQMFVLPLIDCEMTDKTKKTIHSMCSAYQIIYNRLVSQVNSAFEKNMDIVTAYREGKMKRYEALNAITIDYDYPCKDKYSGLTGWSIDYACRAMIKEDMGGGKPYNTVIKTGHVKYLPNEIVTACDKVLAESKEGEVPKLKYKKNCSIVKFAFVKENEFAGMKVDAQHSVLVLKSGEEIKFHINEKHLYEMFAMGCKIKEVAVVIKKIRGKEKFYVQFTLEGTPYLKDFTLGEGKVSIDIGPSTIYALVRKPNGTFEKHEFPLTTLDSIEEDVAKTQQKIDRSHHATTPENYYEDGQAKRKGERIPYRESKRNIRNLNKLTELYRKAQAKKDIEENSIIKKILALGNEFVIEYSPGMGRSWTARKKETKVGKDGRFLSKKRYGKSVSKNAPFRIVSKLERKAGLLGATVKEIPTSCGCTGFDHTNGQYTKYDIDVRQVTLSNGNTHHRDFHSCFNIMYAVGKKKEFDINSMVNDYPAYCLCDLQV